MAETGMHSQRFGVAGGFYCAGDLRRNGHHLDVSIAGLPEFIEEPWRGLRQVLRRMHSAFGVADEWPFQVNAEGRCTILLLLVLSHRVSKVLQRVQQAIFGG